MKRRGFWPKAGQRKETKVKKVALFLVALVLVATGCAGPAATIVTATPTATADLSRRPIGAWPFGPELAEQLLRTGPTGRLDGGRLAAAGRGESRDLQMAVETAEHLAVVAMVRAMGREELVLSPRTEWRGVKPSSSGGFAVTVIVTADVGEGALK